MSKFDFYYLQDSDGYTCATCALSDLKDVLDKEHRETGDPAGRLLAFIEYCEPHDIDDLFRYVDIDCQSWSYRGNNLYRNEKARDLLGDLVACIDDNGDSSNFGENCSGCGTTLIEEFVTCGYCGQAEYGSNFSYSGAPYETWAMDGDDGPMVRFCGHCEDNWIGGSVEQICKDTRRNYTLRFMEEYSGELTEGGYTDQPIYAAGCRRFTLEQALAHWSDPTHYAPASALLLFNGVLRHAMQRALPNLNV